MFSLKVEGTKLVVKLLKEYRGKKANAAIRKGTRAGCKLIQARARKLIPAVARSDAQGTRFRHGRGGLIQYSKGAMRRAVKVRAIKRNRKGWVGTAVVIDTKDAFYAPFVDFGTKKMKARGYMKKAAQQSRDAASAVAIGVIKTELER